MIDFVAARHMMVDGQVRTADVTNPRLLAAMLDLPRERFFPEEKVSLAYLDIDVPVSEGVQPPRRLLKPMVLAKLIQAADIAETDRVLDAGCATGYAAALLAKLAASVVALEEDAGLARQAATALAGVKNVKAVTGPLSAGWPAEAPYDAILLEGATEIVPSALIKQLKPGGRLVCIMGRGPGKATIYQRSETDDVSGRAVFDAAAPLLPGFAKPQEFVF